MNRAGALFLFAASLGLIFWGVWQIHQPSAYITAGAIIWADINSIFTRPRAKG